MSSQRTNAWHNTFNRLQRCDERRENVINAFMDLADAIITVRSLIRQAWTTTAGILDPRVAHDQRINPRGLLVDRIDVDHILPTLPVAARRGSSDTSTCS
jgi:hypothetical protein